MASLILLLGTVGGYAHKSPGTCSLNGLDLAIGVAPTSPSGGGGVVHVGNTIHIRVTYDNSNAADCDVTALGSTLNIPGLAPITVLSGDQALNLEAFECPGDARCNTAGPYTYVVSAGDLIQGPSGCPPVGTGTGPLGIPIYSEFTGTAHIGSVDIPGNATGCKALPLVVLRPSIVCSKECRFIGTPDSPLIEYTITVTNDGISTDLFDVEIVDDQGTPGDATDDVTHSIALLAAGATEVLGPFTYVPVTNPSVNHISVTAHDALFAEDPEGSVVTCEDDCEVSFQCNPDIEVTKQCTAIRNANGTVTVNYSGTVSNEGDVTLTGITVTDNKGGAAIPVADLAPGASANYQGSYELPADTACNTDVTDDVTATGNFNALCPAIGGLHSVSDTTSATCRTPPCSPDIEVIKEVVCALPGDGCAAFPTAAKDSAAHSASGVTINGICPRFCYRITIRNTGDVELNSVVVVDDSNPDPNLNLASCVPNFPTTLAIGQTASCIISGVEHCVNTVNTVTATGQGAFSSGSATDTDTDNVTVLTASIEVTKDCTVSGSPGAFVVTYSGVVRNTGTAALTGVTVVDNKGGAPHAIGNLGPGATADYSGTYNLSAGTACSTDVSDTVTATGTVADSGLCAAVADRTVTDTDDATCRTPACAPHIQVIKEVVCVDPSDQDGCADFPDPAAKGSDAHSATGIKVGDACPKFCYRITIKNTGDIGLNTIVVLDNSSPDPDLNLANCLPNLPTTLAVGASASCIIAGVEHCADTDNTVTATAQGDFNSGPTSDTDSDEVDVLEASLTCTKLVSSPGDLDGNPNDSHVTLLADGAPHAVSYSVVVENTSDAGVWLELTITDELLANCPPFDTGGPLAPGATRTVQLCTVDLTCGQAPLDVELLINTVKVSGLPVPNPEEPDAQFCLPSDEQTGEPIEATSECSATVECKEVFSGCTPGFWKNNAEKKKATAWKVYKPFQTVGVVFTIPACVQSAVPGLAGKTLLSAMQDSKYGNDLSGAARKLIRHAIAALLNATSDCVNYPDSPEEVIAKVNAALASCDVGTINTLHGIFGAQNEAGCPVNQQGQCVGVSQ